jgi:hypothetical protein
LTNMLAQSAIKSAMMAQPDFFILAGAYAALYRSVSQAVISHFQAAHPL